MEFFLSILIIIAAILLILVVLIQNSKGGGLDSNLASQNQSFGAKKTTEIVEKVTWGLAAALIVLSIISTKSISTSANPFDENPGEVDSTEEVQDKEGL